MSSRRLVSGANHNRGSRPSATPAAPSQQQQQQRRNKTELPDYEPLSCPLSEEAKRALMELSNNQDARKYSEQLDQSLKMLESSVGEIYDKFVDRKKTLRNIQEKRGADPAAEKSENERAVEKAVAMLSREVPHLTTSIEASVREIIDWKVELRDNKDAMETTRTKLQNVVVPPRRPGAPRRRRNHDEDDEDGENEDEDMDVDETEDPVDIPGPLAILKEEREKMAEEYASRTLYERYGLDNDYVRFKKMWHDAEFGQDGKPLPDASRWFNENGGGGGGDDDDDELIVEEERVDLHCPLSLVIMTEPYTSPRCRHTFQKLAIDAFLNDKPGRTAKCPQTGCDKDIVKSELYLDEVKLRMVQRELASQNRTPESDDEDDEGNHDADGDTSMRMTRTKNVKTEGRGRRARTVKEDDDSE